MLPNENHDTKNLNLTPYLLGPKKGEYYSEGEIKFCFNISLLSNG